MSKIFMVAVLVIFTFVTADATDLQYEIRKKYGNNDQSASLGKLTITILQGYKNVDARIDPYAQELIVQKDIENHKSVILEFIPLKSDNPAYTDKIFKTTVDEFSITPHGEKISIILGSDQSNIQINSINYIQTRDQKTVGQISTEIIHTVESQNYILSYEQAQKKTAAEQETFFSKYKWYLIIGGVLMYTMLTANPEAAPAPKK